MIRIIDRAIPISIHIGSGLALARGSVQDGPQSSFFLLGRGFGTRAEAGAVAYRGTLRSMKTISRKAVGRLRKRDL